MLAKILKNINTNQNSIKVKQILNLSLLQQQKQSLVYHIRKDITKKEIEDACRICDLASAGNLQAIEQELKEGVDINSKDYDFRTPLHVAAAYGKREIVEFLLQRGAINQADRFGGFPIHDAIRQGHYEIIDILEKYPTIALLNKDLANEYDQQQLEVVFQLVLNAQIFNYEACSREVDYFFNGLGIDNYYFKFFTPPQIAKHINLILAAKDMAKLKKNDEDLSIQITDQDQSYFLFTTQNRADVERKVNEYVETIPINNALSIIYLKSQNPAIINGKDQLEIFVVNQTKFENPKLVKSDDIYQTSTSDFIIKKPLQALKRYQKMLKQASQSPAPVMETFVDQASENLVFMYAVNQGRLVQNDNKICYQLYLMELSRVFQSMNVDIHKKFTETFSNGIVVYTFFTKQQIQQESIQTIFDISNLLLTQNTSQLTHLFLNGQMTGRQLLYFTSSVRFAYYFMNTRYEEFEQLYGYLEKDKKNLSRLLNYQQINRTEEVNFGRMYELIKDNIEDIKHFYIDFSRRLTGQVIPGHEYKDLESIINKYSDAIDRQILQTFQLFNKSVLKTNFYKTTKSAVGFRLDPKVFMKDHKIPEIPFGVFMIAGRDFNGFHIRFRDISRGGVRLIKSNPINYEHNRLTQFQENFNLAYTQKMKNKDIPESGSKGTILMLPGKEHLSELAFNQYVDALSDIMLVTEGVIDHYRKPEFIFLGPDENTADYMDHAALFMKKKGYPYWKSFTTGKSVQLGGIPHDAHGMTTRSVRAYVKGIQQKLGLVEEQCTKFITGGPDGDLGSNEIMMGNEKLIGIVDGSGVLYDPEGLEKQALLKLVKQRIPISNYKGHLSSKGYLVRVSDNNIDLPDGTKIDSGLDFRNTFHLQQFVKSDFFVPCGGRPEAVNMMNVDKMFDKNGKPRFKYIVEGANLFISEDARGVLEEAGVILFKDASANKGGVTSSSLEVLAALALDDVEFAQHMQVSMDGVVPEFYKKYVQEICQIIEKKATLEFEYIWGETKRSGKFSYEITNELSESINNLMDVINSSNLFESEKVRVNVFKKVVPQSLQDLVGLENVLKRVPLAYQQAMLSTYLASIYQYQNQGTVNVYNFYEFMKQFQ